MTLFRYRAARADGAMVKGRVEAASGAEAAAVLSGRGLFPVDIRVLAPSDVWPSRRPPARLLATVLRSLASLTEAGVPLQHALEATEQVADGRLRDAVQRIARRVGEGSSLASAMQAEGTLFAQVTIGLVRAGERGVGLDIALGQAADQLERTAEMSARIRAALTYPALLLGVGLVSVSLIIFFIVPRFVALLGDVDVALPPATLAVLSISALVGDHGAVLLLLGIAVVLVALPVLKSHSDTWNRLLLEAPLIGPIRHGLATARGCRTLGVLLGAGLPVIPALDATRESAGDAATAARIEEAQDRVAEGAALSAALAASRAFTPLATRMAAIGEGSGRLPSLLARAADLEETLSERRLKALVSVLEPALILVFAAVVAFVAAALLQAMYSVRPGGM